MKFQSFTFKIVMAALAVIFLCAGQALAQDTPASMLTLANKQAALAKGQPDAEKTAAMRKAIELYQQIPKRWPEAGQACAKAYLKSAALEQRLGNMEAAFAGFENVLTVKEQASLHAEALLSMASLHRRQKANDKAISCLKKVIEQCSSAGKACAQARLNLGSIARKEKRHLDAMQFARDVLDKHEDLWRENVDAVQLYLSVLIKCRRWDEAKKEMAALDTRIKERFAASEKIESVNKALARISARRMLTPVPVSNG